MILDKIENAEKYFILGDRFKNALEFLKNNDITKLTDGRHDIDGENVYAIISDYTTKDPNGCQPEAHKKYADVQYVASGAELIGYSVYSGQKPFKEYDEEKDFLLYETVTFFMKLYEGMFAIFFPDDIHMPGIRDVVSQPVRKVVIKVKL